MKGKIDLATIGGLVLAFGAIIASVLMEHGKLTSYINASAAILVFGGCLGVIALANPLSDVKRLPKLVILAFREKLRDPQEVMDLIVRLAERARREGMLALEEEAAAISDPFIKKGVMLIVDGTDGELVRSIMEIEIGARSARHESGIAMFEALGGYAPTLGILGTVMGMIRILANMSNASELGAAIAVAFTATLYGVGSANLLYLPIAAKLKRRTHIEEETSHMILDGIMAIQEGDNPYVVRDKLASYFIPSKKKKAASGPDAGADTGGASTAAAAR